MTEVASAFVTLVPSFKGGKAAITRELGPSVEQAGRDGGEQYGRGMSQGIGRTAKMVVAPLIAAFAGVAVGGFLKDAIGQASDLNESVSKTQAIFGNATTAVQTFASGGAKALGQTKIDVLNAAATFGTFGKSAGLQGKDLAKFSTGLVGLSTDMASFYNTSPTDAVEAIGAALRGEAEPIRKYGVLLDDATLRQEAMRLGLIKTTKQALTPQQKVLAAQSAIYKQTKDAQGDFVKTSGGLANQQRILSAQFSDLKTTIGQALLPVALRLVTFFNGNLVPAFGKVKDAVKGLFDLIVKGDFTGALARAFHIDQDSRVVKFILGVRDAVKGVFDILVRGDFTAAFARAFNVSEDAPIVRALIKIHDGIQGIFDLVIHGDFTGAFARAFNVSEDSAVVTNLLRIRDRIISTVTNLGDLPGKLIAVLEGAFAAVKPDVAPLVAHIKEALTQTGGDLISGITTAVQTGDLAPLGKAIGEALATAVKGAAGAVGLFVGGIDTLFAKVDWGSLGLSIGKRAVPLVAGIVVGFMANLFDVVPFIRDHFTEVLIAAVSVIPIGRVAGKLGEVLLHIPFLRVFEPLLRGIASLGGFVESAFAKVFGAVGRVFGEAIGRALPETTGAVTRLLDNVLTTIYVRVADFPAAARALMGGFLGGIREGIVFVLTELIRLPGRMLGALGFLGRLLWGVGRSVIGGFADGFGAGVEGAGGLLPAVRGIPGRVLDSLGELGGLLFRAGTKLVAGLGDGIRFGIKALVKPLQDVANFINDHVPHSPVKRGPLRAWNGGRPGIKLMEMLAGGIVAGSGSLSSAINTAASAVTLPTIGRPGLNTVAPGGAAGAGGFTWNGDLHQHGVTDDSPMRTPMALRQLTYAQGWGS